MKDAYEVLHEKEADAARLRKEIESLNIVAGLLADDEESFDDLGRTSGSLSETISRLSDAAATRAENLVASRSGFWDSLKRAT